jgi:hypothetical protein
MLRKSTLLGSLLLATSALGACRDQATAPTTFAPKEPARLSAATSTASLDGYTMTLPPGVRVFDELSNVGARAINPDDYSCPASTPVVDWLVGKIVGTLQVDQSRFFQALDLGATDLPLYEAIFFQTPATTQFFGYHGEHTQIIEKTERQLTGFWDISSAGIQVVAMHGSMMIDPARTVPAYQFLYGMPAPVATFVADTLRRTLVNSNSMKDGNHPYFTFNSVAIAGLPGYFADKIIMGDGIMAAFDELGFGDVAPQAILAHEFAHHVQFQKDFGIAGDPAEQTRFAELNADALSAFFLTHKRGATLNQKRVEEFLQVFYDIGDCQFADPGHHGTPNQRMAAAEFGFRLADEAQKQGHLLSADEFQAAFLAAYPSLIAPDAT